MRDDLGEGRHAERVGDLKAASNWVLGEFQAHLNADGLTAAASPVTPERLAGLIALVQDGTINQTSAKEVLAALVEDSAATAALVVDTRGLAQVGGADELGAIVDEVLAAHPDEVEAVKGGREQVIGFLVGQCMKASGGRADAKALVKAPPRIPSNMARHPWAIGSAHRRPRIDAPMSIGNRNTALDRFPRIR